MGSCSGGDSSQWLLGKVPGRQRQAAKESCRRRSSKLVAKELDMSTNKDQVKGALKDIGGKIQEEAGKLVGSTKQQVKGLKNQTKGKIQKGVGDLKEAVS